MNPTRRHHVLKAAAYARTLALLRAKGVRHGARPLFRGLLPQIHAWGDVVVGDGFRVRGAQFRTAFGADAGARLEFGDGVYLNQGVHVHAARSIRLGDNVRLADLVTIYDSNEHEVEEGGGVRVAPVHIGDNVWLARNVTVLPGVSIGENSVVAAGSVVVADLPANVLAAGNPAQVLRPLRASDEWVRR